jgi:DNA repair exonuclease SbcCD ATPase subunit
MILLRRLRVHALKHLRDVDIWFPRHGSVLIEGHNESGKSTLFEAIYFALYGAPLVGEDGSPSLASLIPHGEDSALVGLTLLAGDTELEIRRELKLGAGKRQKHDARLVVRRPGDKLEALNTVAAVNARILQEVHGLDGNALRNSCLMEQQALDRIEALSRDAREDAIARLLGLDVLRRAAKDLQPVRADETRLGDLRARLEVAQSQRAAQDATLRETESAARWRAADVLRELHARDRLLAAQSVVETESTLDTSREERLRRRVDSARRAEALLARVDEAGRELAMGREASEKAAALAFRLATFEEQIRDRLPAVETRLAALARLQPALVAANQRLAQLSIAAQLTQEESTARGAVAEARQRAGEAEQEATTAQSIAARAEARDSLERWLRIAEGSGPSEVQAHIDKIWAEFNARQRSQAAAREQVRTWQVLALLASGGSIVMLLLGATSHLLWLASVAAAIGAALFVMLWRRARARFVSLASDVERLQHALHVAVPDQAGSRERAAMEAALARAALDVPHNAASGRQILEQLGHDLPPAAEAHNRADKSAVRLQERQSQLRLAELDLERARQARIAAGVPDDAIQASIDQEQMAAEATQATVRDELAAMGIAPGIEAVSAARGAAEVELRGLREREAEHEQLMVDERQASQIADELRVRWATLLSSLATEASSQDIVVQELPDIAGATIEALQQEHAVLASAVRAWLADLDAAGAQAELAALAVRREGQDERARSAQEEAARRTQRLRELLTEQGILYMGGETLQDLGARWPLLAEVAAADVEELHARADKAHVDAEYARRSAAAMAERHHLDAAMVAALDEASCQQAVDEAERDLRRRRIAAELADEAFARIVRRVLPETKVHMRAVLPELTAGRYRDVQLLHDDVRSADVRIRVWDQLAGRYVAKNLFSGGTRDQCSLALRLAFALATLPKELGAIPGFIFLDEPLSSFDAERSRALVHILTQGTIARHFAQVFLISHSRSFDSGSFAYRLRMSGGRVTESTLPHEEEAQHLWAAEAAISQAP